MVCEINADALFSRGNTVCELVAPLTGSTRVAFDYSSRKPDVFLGVFSGSKSFSGDYRDWRFTTSVPRMRGSYFERWLPVDEKQKRYYLDRAYLHLYRRPQAMGLVQEIQILALHCDPNEPNDAEHALYKQGPHLHVLTAEQPMPHSHVSLNLNNLVKTLSSIDELFLAWQKAIKMLKDQVLELYRASPPK